MGLSILDGTFVIKARQPEEARAFLTRPGVEDALLEVYGTFGTMRVEGGAIIVENYGTDAAFDMEINLDSLAMTLATMKPEASPSRDAPTHAQTDAPSHPPADRRPQKFGRPESDTPAPPQHAEPAATEDDDDWW